MSEAESPRDSESSAKVCIFCAGTGESLGGNGRYMKCWPCDGTGYVTKSKDDES